MLGESTITSDGRTHWRSLPLPLRGDPVEHSDEIARFRQRVVTHPLDTDYTVWAED